MILFTNPFFFFKKFIVNLLCHIINEKFRAGPELAQTLY